MVISMVVLAYHAFPFDLPTTRIKDDRYRGELNSFGAFCFYRDGENFIFYKNFSFHKKIEKFILY